MKEDNNNNHLREWVKTKTQPLQHKITT